MPPDSSSDCAPTLPAGVYRHYKGQSYEVFNVVRHSESREYLVHYRCLYGDYSHWVRPFDMFTESVVVDGIERPRFQHITQAAS